MKSLNNLKLIVLLSALLAVAPFQSGFCCQGKGATCDNEGQKCCPIDDETQKPLECIGIEEYGVGECKIKEDSKE